MQINLTATNELCKDILCTAAEGGSTYWAAFRVKNPTDYDSATVYECGDEDKPVKHSVTLETIRTGIARILAGGKVNDDIAANVLRAVHRNDAGYLDADDADAVLQVGLFDEVTYG